MSIKTLVIILLMCLQVKAQWSKAGIYERRWAIVHPFAAFKVKKITKECTRFMSGQNMNLVLDAHTSGGKADAYRHIFFMAAYSQKIKQKKVRKLGLAHEKSNYKQFLNSSEEYGELPDSMSTVMDLYNNELGFVIGLNNKKDDLETLSGRVIKEIKNGKALIMKRNLKGSYLNCSGELIDLTFYKKKWNIPKCLTNSNYNYK